MVQVDEKLNELQSTLAHKPSTSQEEAKQNESPGYQTKVSHAEWKMQKQEDC